MMNHLPCRMSHALRIPRIGDYKTQISVDPVTATSFMELEGRYARRPVTGLVSGQRSWVRVAATRGLDVGPWSDPVAFIPPLTVAHSRRDAPGGHRDGLRGNRRGAVPTAPGGYVR